MGNVDARLINALNSCPTNFSYFLFWVAFCSLLVFSRYFFSLDTGTGGRRVSARRAGRAELRRTPTEESGVVH